MRSRRKGISTIYMVLYMVVLCALCSLAVDLGRVQVAKTELRRAADTAARAGAAGLGVDAAEAVRLAQLYALRNKVDGQPLVLTAADVEIGKWDTKTKSFNKLSGFDLSGANAVRVIGRRHASRGTAIPMMFARLVGFQSCNVNAESIAIIIPAVKVDQYVPATANPFLAGMPFGAKASGINPHNSPDFAGTESNPRQSPLAVEMMLTEGQGLTFDSISGTARHDPNLPFFNPDGEVGDMGHNNLTKSNSSSYSSSFFNENGISDMRAPINALVGVFLSDEAPNKTPAPKNLDFSTDISRDFTDFKPELKQIFWIGDGMNSKGNRQNFIVPKGATRLYLATWDFYEWNNNYGFRNIKVNRPMQITTVK